MQTWLLCTKSLLKPKKNAFRKFINLKYDSIKSKLKEKKEKINI